MFRATRREVIKYFDEVNDDPEYISKQLEIWKKQEALSEELRDCHRRVFQRIVLKHREENHEES